jgi:hypothetical protein
MCAPEAREQVIFVGYDQSLVVREVLAGRADVG